MRSILLMTVISMAMLCTGCATFLGQDGSKPTIDPYQLGRASTVAYLLTKDKMDEDHVKTIKTVYMVFEGSILLVTGENAILFKSILKEEVTKALNGKDPKYLIIASQIIDFYWDKLTNQVDMTSVGKEDAVQVLTKFYKGTKDALNEYSGFK